VHPEGIGGGLFADVDGLTPPPVGRPGIFAYLTATDFGDPANEQLYIDVHRLETLHVSLKDVASFLASQSYVAAAFTEDEVKGAGARLTR
jgi:hypothetical protein